jgi:cystathionine beta-lyase
MWLDCNSLHLNQEELRKFFYNKAKLGLNDGVSFGHAGEGFMRLNVGTGREVLEIAMQRLLQAVKDRDA